MKLEEIIVIANRAYPDDLIQQVFTAKGKKGVGDGLAEFIVRELKDTYEESGTSLEQLEMAAMCLVWARREMESVENAVRCAVIKLQSPK